MRRNGNLSRSEFRSTEVNNLIKAPQYFFVCLFFLFCFFVCLFAKSCPNPIRSKVIEYVIPAVQKSPALGLREMEPPENRFLSHLTEVPNTGFV